MGAIQRDITGRGKVTERMVWEYRLIQALGSDGEEVRVGRSGEKCNRIGELLCNEVSNAAA